MIYKVIYYNLLALFPVYVVSAELRDPTIPDKPAVATLSTEQSTASQKPTLLELSGIWISAHSKRAMINGTHVQQGDTLPNDVQIIAITENRVTIRNQGIIQTLHLHQRSYITR